MGYIRLHEPDGRILLSLRVYPGACRLALLSVQPTGGLVSRSPPFSVLPAMGASRLDGVLWILGLLWAFRVSAESQEKHEMTEDRVPKLRHNYIELHS